MTNDKAIQLAREAAEELGKVRVALDADFIALFAKKVEAVEREGCVNAAETRQKIEGARWAGFTAMKIVEAIRARGNV